MTSSHRVPPFASWNNLLTLLSCVLQSDIWELFEGYGEIGTILISKLERSLPRNCILMFECNSQGYTFLFSVLFADTRFWKSAFGYLWMQRRLQVTKEISSDENKQEAMLETSWWCVNSSQRVTLSFMQQSIITVIEEAEKDFFGSHWGLRW